MQAPPNEEEGEEEEGEGEEGEWAAGEPFDDGDEYEEEEGWGGVEVRTRETFFFLLLFFQK